MTALKALHAELAAAREHVAKLEKAIACFEPPAAPSVRPKRKYTRRAPKSKLCQRCGVDKPVSDWWRHHSSPDGLQYACKACLGEAQRLSLRRSIERRQQAALMLRPMLCPCCRGMHWLWIEVLRCAMRRANADR